MFVRWGGHRYGPKDPGWAEPQSLGEKSINGVNAIGTRRQYTIAVGVVGNEKPIVLTVEQWFNPELGLLVSRTGTASLGGQFHTEVENIYARDPDPTLFTIPSDSTRTEIDPRAAAKAAMQAVAKKGFSVRLEVGSKLPENVQPPTVLLAKLFSCQA
jgi:hypothetical protein